MYQKIKITITYNQISKYVNSCNQDQNINPILIQSNNHAMGKQRSNVNAQKSTKLTK